MNLKAYLRGIGAGMIVTALVMSVSMKPAKDPATVIDKTTLIESVSSASTTVSASTGTEDETGKKDENKGSTSAASTTVSASASTETSVSTEETKTEDAEPVNPGETGEEGAASIETGEAEGSETGEGNEASESAGSSINPMPEGDPGYTEEGDSVEIRVIKGDSSVSVSRRMFEAGLVESAVEFDKYLCANGYDKSISVGTYQIEYGLDFETMAKIITRRK